MSQLPKMDASSTQRQIPAVQAGPPAPPTYIKPTSPFRPRDRECCQCREISPEPQTQQHQEAQSCSHSDCAHAFCGDCIRLDARGDIVIPHSIPADWICSTCGVTHSVLDIMTQSVSCECENPRLQTVYDQYGRIYLYWRNEDAILDLRDPAQVEEASWRMMGAGAHLWLADVLAIEEEKKSEMKDMNRGERWGWNRTS